MIPVILAFIFGVSAGICIMLLTPQTIVQEEPKPSDGIMEDIMNPTFHPS